MEHINYGRGNEGWNMKTMAEKMKGGTYKLWQSK